MAGPRKPAEPRRSRRAPAKTVEAREAQLISLAIDLAEQQMLEGSASSQVITHYLKLGTTRERLEQKKLEEEHKLLMAKTEAIASGQRIEALYAEAIEAMGKYSGRDDSEDFDDTNVF